MYIYIIIFINNNKANRNLFLVGLAGGWFGASGYDYMHEAKDYMLLYNETIRPIVTELDPSRPYLLSSPSNGIKTDE